MCNQGFIKLSRKFFETPLWKEPRQYSRSEAWLDLIQMAGFEDSKYILNNREIEVRRGEIVASRRFLENRWNWGSTKVSNFIDYLKANRMINQRQTSGQTIITLCNYDICNDKQTKSRERNKPPCKPDTNQTQTTDKPPTNQNKESKEGKEYINPPMNPPCDESVPLEILKRNVLDSEQVWLDTIGMNRHLTPVSVKTWLNTFFAELDMNGETTKTLKDFKSHFNRWLKIQLEKEKVAPKRKSNFANLNNEQRYEDF